MIFSSFSFLATIVPLQALAHILSVARILSYSEFGYSYISGSNIAQLFYIPLYNFFMPYATCEILFIRIWYRHSDSLAVFEKGEFISFL